MSKDGTHNLAPYSFFNAFNYHPPIIGFSSIGFKDTLRNVKEAGDFTWNLATQELATAMNMTSDPLTADEDEFKHASLTPASSTIVTSPRVAESVASFECRVSQVVQLEGQKGGVLDTWLVLGEVVAVHVDKSLISEEGKFDTLAARPVMR